MRSVVAAILLLVAVATPCRAEKWSGVTRDLVRAYDGVIRTITRLDEAHCWVVVAPHLSNQDCVTTAENIGYFIRNVTGTQGLRPVVHVVRGGAQVAVARPQGAEYVGELSVRRLDAEGSSVAY